MNDLEARLRAELRDGRHALAPWPDATARIGALTARRRRRRATLTAAVVAVAVAGVASLAIALAAHRTDNLPSGPVGSAAPSGTSAPAGSLVAWLATPASPVPPSAPPSRAPTTPCTATDLSKAAFDRGGAAGGHVGYRVSVVNVGPHRCTLTASGEVRGTDVTAGRAVTLTSGEPTFFDSPTEERPPTLDSGESAVLTIVGETGCNGGIGLHTYRFTEVTVAGRRDPLTGVQVQASCPPAIGPWARPVPEPATVPSPPAYPSTLRAGIVDPPATVNRGGELRYTVTLTNDGDAPVDLRPCPAYTESLGKVHLSYQLNCAVPVVPAHGSVSFAMVLPLPEDALLLPSGSAPMTWGIGFPGDETLTADTRMTVA